VHGVCGRGETGLRRAHGSESSGPVQPLVIFRSPRRHDVSTPVRPIMSGCATSRYPYSERCMALGIRTRDLQSPILEISGACTAFGCLIFCACRVRGSRSLPEGPTLPIAQRRTLAWPACARRAVDCNPWGTSIDRTGWLPLHIRDGIACMGGLATSSTHNVIALCVRGESE
jgi:hypothetical protein